jgi:hypothetical protein
MWRIAIVQCSGKRGMPVDMLFSLVSPEAYVVVVGLLVKGFQFFFIQSCTGSKFRTGFE